MTTKYCHYCCQHKDGTGFKAWRDPRNNMPRSMCGPCQAKRKMTPAQRAEAERDSKEAKRLIVSAQAKENATKKREAT